MLRQKCLYTPVKNCHNLKEKSTTLRFNFKTQPKKHQQHFVSITLNCMKPEWVDSHQGIRLNLLLWLRLWLRLLLADLDRRASLSGVLGTHGLITQIKPM